MEFSSNELVFPFQSNSHLATNLTLKNTSNFNQMFKVTQSLFSSKHRPQTDLGLSPVWGLSSRTNKHQFRLSYTNKFITEISRLSKITKIKKFNSSMAKALKIQRVLRALCFESNFKRCSHNSS